MRDISMFGTASNDTMQKDKIVGKKLRSRWRKYVPFDIKGLEIRTGD